MTGGMCGGATRASRATERKERMNMSDEKNNPNDQTDPIRVIMLFGLTPKQRKEIKAAAARAGVHPLIYLYGLVQREPERFIAPLPVEAVAARAGGTHMPCAPAGDGCSPEAGSAAPAKDNAPR